MATILSSLCAAGSIIHQGQYTLPTDTTNLPSLPCAIEGDFVVDNCDSLLVSGNDGTATFAGLKQVTGNLVIKNNDYIQKVSFPDLVWVGNLDADSNHASFKWTRFAVLEHINGTVDATNTALVESSTAACTSPLVDLGTPALLLMCSCQQESGKVFTLDGGTTNATCKQCTDCADYESETLTRCTLKHDATCMGYGDPSLRFGINNVGKVADLMTIVTGTLAGVVAWFAVVFFGYTFCVKEFPITRIIVTPKKRQGHIVDESLEVEVHHKAIAKPLVVGQKVRIRGTTNFNGLKIVTYIKTTESFCFDQDTDNNGAKLHAKFQGEGSEDPLPSLTKHPYAAFSVGSRPSLKAKETAKIVPTANDVVEVNTTDEIGQETKVGKSPEKDKNDPEAAAESNTASGEGGDADANSPLIIKTENPGEFSGGEAGASVEAKETEEAAKDTQAPVPAGVDDDEPGEEKKEEELL